MKCSLILSLFSCLVLVAVPAAGQVGPLGIYADPGATNCQLRDDVAGLQTFYVVDLSPAGSKGVQFSAPLLGCMVGAVYLSDTPQYPVTIGTSQTGVAIGYGGACVSGPNAVLAINVFGAGLTSADCAWSILPDPNVLSGMVEFADCNDNLVTGDGCTSYVNSLLECDCGVIVPPVDPVLSVVPLFVDMGATTTQKPFFISNAGGGVLNWNLTESAPWLSLSATSGTNDATITAFVDRTGLATGTHSANIAVTSNGGNETVTVQLSVPIPNPQLLVFPPSLSFPHPTDSDQISIINGGSGDLTWTATPNFPWMVVSSAAGTGNATITVTVNRQGLLAGDYNGEVLIESNGGDATVAVTMEVITDPILDVRPTVLTFTPTTSLMQTFDIRNVGVGTLTWNVTTTSPWIDGFPLSGENDQTIAVEVDPSIVPPGNASATVLVTTNVGSAQVSVFYNRGGPSGGAGAVGVYPDQAGTNCQLTDVVGLNAYYVVHTNTAGATAVQFSAPLPACYTAGVWLSDTPQYPVTIGSSQNGVAVGYGACMGAPNVVLLINIFGQGLTGPCCQWQALPDPNVASGRIEVVDCGNNLFFGFGFTSYVNGNANCSCTVSVEETTWGKVKAIYAPEKTGAFKH